MQMTELVVPRSMPAVVARPRNPILAMMTNAKMTTPMREGMSASNPPDLESSACLLVILDFFFFFTMRLLQLDCDCVERAESCICLDHACCLSRFLLRRR